MNSALSILFCLLVAVLLVAQSQATLPPSMEATADPVATTDTTATMTDATTPTAPIEPVAVIFVFKNPEEEGGDDEPVAEPPAEEEEAPEEPTPGRRLSNYGYYGFRGYPGYFNRGFGYRGFY